MNTGRDRGEAGMNDLVKLLRAAGHNETLASGELYLAAADRIEDFILRLESLPRHPAPDQPANMETGKWVQWDALLSVIEDMAEEKDET
jgi:hypothetical protein